VFFELRHLAREVSVVSSPAMVKVTLPDGSQREIPAGTRVVDLAASIGAGLAKACLGAKIDGASEITDLRMPIVRDCKIEIVTDKSPDGLRVIRHSASHVMADAICQLWPAAKLTIGPATDEGFYYDIDLDHKITEDDLAKIEERMKAIVMADHKFERCAVEREPTLKRFQEHGEIYKAELIEGFDPQAPITLYRHGVFEDLCMGPHVPSTGSIKAWKILKVAGSYWRGDENRQVLQRIYGTAFASRKDLDDYIHQLEEAKKRDHRKLGKELDLVMFSQLAPASPFFKPKGTVVYNLLQSYIRALYLRYGYQEVITPQIFDVELWKRSGHYDKYKDNMYFTTIEKADYAVKPMNCPSHTLIYSSDMRSYRDLPLRIADFGRLHRYERSGVTAGLTRVRSFCQDDAHIFCREDQIEDEIAGVIRMINEVYRTFGFDDVKVFLSTRPEQSVGSDEIWRKAEAALEKAIQNNELAYTVNPGDGAFYGPKIDFIVADALKREWQLGTIQLDFNMPERFDLEYVNPEGGNSRPVMVHRAVLGSIERFMGILIEHYAGAFPLWLAPVQVKVLTINDSHQAYGEDVVAALKSAGVRVEGDFQNAKIGAKIRDAEMMRIPYILVIGGREVTDKTVAVRERAKGDLGSQSLEAFLAALHERNVAKT
jgi:threonyl-tRNA synthetase